MNETELDDYLKNITISLGVLHNYIDYENIEKPVQTIYQKPTVYRLNPNSTNIEKIIFQKHQFTDNTSRLQLFGGESSTEFLTLQKIDESEVFFARDTMLNLNFMLG